MSTTSDKKQIEEMNKIFFERAMENAEDVSFTEITEEDSALKEKVEINTETLEEARERFETFKNEVISRIAGADKAAAMQLVAEYEAFKDAYPQEILNKLAEENQETIKQLNALAGVYRGKVHAELPETLKIEALQNRYLALQDKMASVLDNLPKDKSATLHDEISVLESRYTDIMNTGELRDDLNANNIARLSQLVDAYAHMITTYTEHIPKESERESLVKKYNSIIDSGSDLFGKLTGERRDDFQLKIAELNESHPDLFENGVLSANASLGELEDFLGAYENILKEYNGGSEQSEASESFVKLQSRARKLLRDRKELLHFAEDADRKEFADDFFKLLDEYKDIFHEGGKFRVADIDPRNEKRFKQFLDEFARLLNILAKKISTFEKDDSHKEKGIVKIEVSEEEQETEVVEESLDARKQLLEACGDEALAQKIIDLAAEGKTHGQIIRELDLKNNELVVHAVVAYVQAVSTPTPTSAPTLVPTPAPAPTSAPAPEVAPTSTETEQEPGIEKLEMVELNRDELREAFESDPVIIESLKEALSGGEVELLDFETTLFSVLENYCREKLHFTEEQFSQMGGMVAELASSVTQEVYAALDSELELKAQKETGTFRRALSRMSGRAKLSMAASIATGLGIGVLSRLVMPVGRRFIKNVAIAGVTGAVSGFARIAGAFGINNFSKWRKKKKGIETTEEEEANLRESELIAEKRKNILERGRYAVLDVEKIANIVATKVYAETAGLADVEGGLDYRDMHRRRDGKYTESVDIKQKAEAMREAESKIQALITDPIQCKSALYSLKHGETVETVLQGYPDIENQEELKTAFETYTTARIEFKSAKHEFSDNKDREQFREKLKGLYKNIEEFVNNSPEFADLSDHDKKLEAKRLFLVASREQMNQESVLDLMKEKELSTNIVDSLSKFRNILSGSAFVGQLDYEAGVKDARKHAFVAAGVGAITRMVTAVGDDYIRAAMFSAGGLAIGASLVEVDQGKLLAEYIDSLETIVVQSENKIQDIVRSGDIYNIEDRNLAQDVQYMRMVLSLKRDAKTPLIESKALRARAEGMIHQFNVLKAQHHIDDIRRLRGEKTSEKEREREGAEGTIDLYENKEPNIHEKENHFYGVMTNMENKVASRRAAMASQIETKLKDKINKRKWLRRASATIGLVAGGVVGFLLDDVTGKAAEKIGLKPEKLDGHSAGKPSGEITPIESLDGHAHLDELPKIVGNQRDFNLLMNESSSGHLTEAQQVQAAMTMNNLKIHDPKLYEYYLAQYNGPEDALAGSAGGSKITPIEDLEKQGSGAGTGAGDTPVETPEHKNVIDVPKEAIINKGEGVEHVLREQVAADPKRFEEFGLPKDATPKQIAHFAHVLAIKEGYFKGPYNDIFEKAQEAVEKAGGNPHDLLAVNKEALALAKAEGITPDKFFTDETRVMMTQEGSAYTAIRGNDGELHIIETDAKGNIEGTVGVIDKAHEYSKGFRVHEGTDHDLASMQADHTMVEDIPQRGIDIGPDTHVETAVTESVQHDIDTVRESIYQNNINTNEFKEASKRLLEELKEHPEYVQNNGFKEGVVNALDRNIIENINNGGPALESTVGTLAGVYGLGERYGDTEAYIKILSMEKGNINLQDALKSNGFINGMDINHSRIAGDIENFRDDITNPNLPPKDSLVPRTLYGEIKDGKLVPKPEEVVLAHRLKDGNIEIIRIADGDETTSKVTEQEFRDLMKPTRLDVAPIPPETEDIPADETITDTTKLENEVKSETTPEVTSEVTGDVKEFFNKVSKAVAKTSENIVHKHISGDSLLTPEELAAHQSLAERGSSLIEDIRQRNLSPEEITQLRGTLDAFMEQDNDPIDKARFDEMIKALGEIKQ